MGRRGLIRSGLLTATSGVGGAVLGAVFGATALARRSKPLHPAGAVARARLAVTPAPVPSGSPLLDEPDEYDCVVRASYAVGAGPEHADIEGFALRVLDVGGDRDIVDILFASTGVGPLGRHVLAVRPAGVHAAQTTLLPVRAAGHALYLRLDPLDADSRPWPATYRLFWAHGLGAWLPFGTLTVTWGEPGDAPERFDPVVNPIRGTAQYRAVATVREPAYRMARLAWPRAGRLPAERAGGR